jgi:hypothetical protein
MQEWLTLHNVTFDRTMTKKQLYELIKPFNNHNNRRYLIDDILQRHGHIVLRLQTKLKMYGLNHYLNVAPVFGNTM